MSGLSTSRKSPCDSAYAWLLPRANPSLPGLATRRTRASAPNSARTMSALPSDEALSTTIVSARIPSTDCSADLRQSRSRSRVFHETTRIERSGQTISDPATDVDQVGGGLGRSRRAQDAAQRPLEPAQ